MQIINGLVFGQDQTFAKRDIAIADGKFVQEAEGTVVEASGCYVVPGLVDIHTHGAMNHDFSDGNREGFQEIAAFFATKGTTSFLATTMTLGEDVLTCAVEVARDFTPTHHQAQCLGVHLEGPFLAESKKGAQSSAYLAEPDLDLFYRLQAASGNGVRLITMAPEQPWGLAFVQAVQKGCRVSVGHTAADYQTVVQAMEAGASHCTHLFNGMNGLHHRYPAVVGAAYDKGATVELICDGIHIHPSVVRMVHKLFDRRLVLISDSIRCTGLSDGDYTLGGQLVHVKDGFCLLEDGTLAGSSISLHDGVVRAVSFGVPLESAIYGATYVPAKVIGMEHQVGVIAPGYQADCLILNPDLSIRQVILRGRPL